MNITGIIVEYNPFHNGHAHHIFETKKQTQADLIVAVMSGNFLQRGEPALVSKWARTRMALAAGVDLVLELPYVFATQHAQIFAEGAISILKAIGGNAVCFGSESGDIQQFITQVSFLKEHEKTYNTFVQDALAQGNSYPKALALAFHKMNNHEEFVDLTKPNNILGYHYVKAIYDQRAQIKPYSIIRTSAQYHDKQISNLAIASATSIREALIEQKKDLEAVRHVVPNETFVELQNYLQIHSSFQYWERLFPFLKYKLLTTTPKQLANIYEAEEGLENRILQIINQATSFQSLMQKLKTKRYTWTRLQRFCVHILTNTTKEEMYHRHVACPYIRVLGMNNKGREFLNKQKKKIEVPLISTVSKCNHPFIEIEKRATTCYSLGYDPLIQKKLTEQEYAQPPLLL